MTAADLARRTGISPGLISNWINGRRRPSRESCYVIADVLDLPLDVVLKQVGHLPGDVEAEEEQTREDALVGMYRRLSDDAQRQILEFVTWHRERERLKGGV